MEMQCHGLQGVTLHGASKLQTWSSEEDLAVILAVARHGKLWRLIKADPLLGQALLHRSSKAIKCRFGRLLANLNKPKNARPRRVVGRPRQLKPLLPG